MADLWSKMANSTTTPEIGGAVIWEFVSSRSVSGNKLGHVVSLSPKYNLPTVKGR